MLGPLHGLRVLDLSTNFMGPYASLLLADMGADICKVEPPEGDTTRQVGPARHAGMAAIFLHLNRNKRSIVLDLKNPSGLQALKTMVRQADVLMFSLRPLTMEKLGLGYAQLHALNPRLIYCGGFGFGQKGPYADRPAYDNLIQAGVGMPMVQARKTDGPPTYVGTAIADRLVGMAVSNAILGALHHRAQTGRGQAVEVPMFETFAHFFMGDHMYGHTFVPAEGDWGYARMVTPKRRPFPTRDGHIAVDVYTDRHWQRLFQVVGRPEMAADPRFVDIPSRAQHIDALNAFLCEVFADDDTARWVERLVAADIPAMPMHTPHSLLSDPHMQAVDFFPEVDHPTEGRIRAIGIPTAWSDSPADLGRPAPGLGQHTRELLAEFGVPPVEVERLLREGGARE